MESIVYFDKLLACYSHCKENIFFVQMNMLEYYIFPFRIDFQHIPAIL